MQQSEVITCCAIQELTFKEYEGPVKFVIFAGKLGKIYLAKLMGNEGFSEFKSCHTNEIT